MRQVAAGVEKTGLGDWFDSGEGEGLRERKASGEWCCLLRWSTHLRGRDVRVQYCAIDFKINIFHI